jgi:hypothetical protein
VPRPGLIVDHFGDFDGFILDTDTREHRYRSRERSLAERAWRERLRIRVCAESEHHELIGSITVSEPPAH